MPDRLLRRGGVFYYHRRVPLTAVSAVGKKIVTFSLGTRDPKVAKKLRDLEDVKWNAKFEKAEVPATTLASEAPAPAQTGLVQLVKDYVDAADERSRSLLIANPPANMAEKEEAIVDAEIGLQILKNIDDPNGAACVHSVGTKVLAGAGAVPDVSHIFGEIVRRGLLELQNRKVSRLCDDFSHSYFDQMFGPQPVVTAITFGQVADQFIVITEENATANGNSQKWVDKQRANVALLKEVVGSTTSISDVDYDACMRVRSGLAAIPANMGKIYKSLPLEDAIRQGQADGKPTLSPVTQEQYLSTFRGILDLAAKKRHLAVNPAAGLKPLKKDTVTAGEKRLPFTQEQLEGFFQGSFYRACATEASPPYSYDGMGWRFWMPLLTLFMGMRPNEVCPLEARDVKQTVAGTWFVDVVNSDDEDDSLVIKQLKTATSRRKIPIHPELIAMGIVEFARQRLVKGPAARLFPDLQPDEYGNYAKYALKRFREVFLPQEIQVKKRQSFYSLRHNFRDALRRSNAPPDTLQALGGWSQGKLVSDDYGEKANPDFQAQYMAAVSYPNLDFTALHIKVGAGTASAPAAET